MKITLQLFGAYRVFGENLYFDLDDGAKVFDIRNEITKQLKDNKAFNEALLKSSRFANEKEILDEGHPLNDGDKIAIIPPVAGG